MRTCTRLLVVALPGFFVGCAGSPAPEPTVLRGPHHGTTLQLPEKMGYVELVNEPEVKDRRSNEPTALVAYFLKDDAQSPVDPLPSEVSFAIDSGGRREGRARKGSPEVLPLGAEPRSGDPAGAGRFVSKPGPYQLASLRGTLSASFNGQMVSVILQGSR
jgi:hypothetical protein